MAVQLLLCYLPAAAVHQNQRGLVKVCRCGVGVWCVS